jgi:hypothetical protein
VPQATHPAGRTDVKPGRRRPDPTLPRPRAQLGVDRVQEGLDLAVFLQERLHQHLIDLQVHLPGRQLPLQGAERPQEVLESKKTQTLHRPDTAGLPRQDRGQRHQEQATGDCHLPD